MTTSAIPTREDRRERTSARITSVARRRTIESGLSGFTVEDVCAEVGISRRTFFNYFPSKDEAVLGVHESEDSERIEAEFLALGSHGWPAVLDDLIELTIVNTDLSDHDPEEHAGFFTILDREPKLLARVVGLTREREQALAAVIAQREGVDVDDSRVQAVVTLFSTILRITVERMLRPDGAADFGAALHLSLSAAREVAAPSVPRKDHS